MKSPVQRDTESGARSLSKFNISVVTPPGSYHVNGEVQGHTTALLVDTGASVTLMRKDVWDRVNQAQGVRLEPWTERQLVSVNGSPLKIYGHAPAAITMEGIAYSADIVVVSPLTSEVILGLDFLREHEAVVDVKKSEIRMGDKVVALHLSPPSCPKVDAISRVCLSTSTTLPPYSEKVVMAECKGPLQSGSCIIEPGSGERLPVAVARALVEPKGGRIPVRLLNPGPETATLRPQSVVATLESVETPPENVVASVPTLAPTVDTAKAELLWEIVEQSSGELTSGEKEQFFAMLLNNADIFAASKSDLGRTTRLQHRINTGPAPPIRQAVRRLPPPRRREVQELLAGMLENEVVQPSSSPWASPIVLVKKKDNSFRFCVDYRKLNEVTHKDAYPLPRIDDTLDSLSGSKWFSTIDLLSGYWQVEVAEEDRPKTAFCTTEGLFEFKVMPFGLSNAPATFQRLMDLVLSGLQWSQCLVYLDDVIILGRSFSEHLANLNMVFERLREAGLKLQPKKCNFLRHEVAYLGHVVSDKGVTADPAKVERVASWPIPTTTKDVQRFLGFAGYYRRFIQNFADIARPLHRLTEQYAAFKWSDESQSAFEELKQRLISAPVLAYPDFSKKFVLDTDASDLGIGAVLSQVDDEGREHVIAYASRLLSKPERRYCVTRRELLAVVVFTKHFRHFLIGRHFTLRTDHGSLTWLKNFREPEGQMARWLERLQELDFTIVHRQGKKHKNADALSRLPCQQCGRDSHSDEVRVVALTSLVGGEELGRLQNEDATIGLLVQAKLQGEKPPPTQIKSLSKDARRLFQLWDQLVMKNGILYRQYENTKD